MVEKIILTDVSPGSRAPLSVTIINDTDVEREESFSLLLSPSSPGILINASMAIVTIVDDDCEYLLIIVTASIFYCGIIVTVVVGVGFDPVAYNVSEGEVAMLRVTLTATTDRTITVDLLTQSGTARGKLQIQKLHYFVTRSYYTYES